MRALCLLGASIVAMWLIAVDFLSTGCHDAQVLVHFGPSKQETLEFGQAVLAAIQQHKEKVGRFPYQLGEVSNLPTHSEIQLEYAVGDTGELMTINVSSGPYKWCYCECFKSWIDDELSGRSD